jgi:magnesium chelatase family protein
MVVRGNAAALLGVDARLVTVEASLSPSFDGGGTYIIGLPDNTVRESLYRCDAAIRNSNFEPIRQRLVINLSPGDIRKEGSSYDLTIGMVMLCASYQLGDIGALEGWMIMGELGLDGRVLSMKGALSVAILARKQGIKRVIVPLENAREAAMVKDIEVYGVETLREAAEIVRGESSKKPVFVEARTEFEDSFLDFGVDFLDVKGHDAAKRAFEVAAAGGHNLIMVGSPGSGKTLLAKRMPSILPPLSLHESLETTKIHSVAGRLVGKGGLVSQRPFRSPHHTISDIAMIGGGVNPMPGEISLAHHGVLFLDELPEFKKSVLETLRQPLEDRTIIINRAKYEAEFPAHFMLLASMNPCPCGYAMHHQRECTCSAVAIQKYRSKVSGPLLDRIDIQIEVETQDLEMESTRKVDSSAEIRARVITARQIQRDRFLAAKIGGITSNAGMGTGELSKFCVLSSLGSMLLKAAIQKLNLSHRAHDRILKVGRTIADLAGSESIMPEHIAEAIQYRSLDRE